MILEKYCGLIIVIFYNLINVFFLNLINADVGFWKNIVGLLLLFFII